MTNTNSVCTNCVVLAQQQQAVVQHHEPSSESATPTPKLPQKQCTVVENGKVVVRPIAPQT